MDIKKSDVHILVSMINLKLRDFYKNLDILCEDLDINKEELIEKLKSGNYEYLESINQFR